MRTVTILLLTCLATPSVWAQASPTRVIVMPPDLRVMEISAGGVLDILPEETEATKSTWFAAVANRFQNSRAYSVVEMPELSPEETTLLREYVALYSRVSEQAVEMIGDGGWGHKKRAFDYTVGPGLRFLADRSGADKAVFTGGHVMQSSGGRILLTIAAAAAGYGVPSGSTNVSVSIVDLHTGEVEWLNATQYFGGQTVQHDSATVLAALFKDFPKSKYHARKL